MSLLTPVPSSPRASRSPPPVFRTVATAAERLGLKVCIPRIVLEETRNRFREDLEEQCEKLNRAIRRYAHLTGAEFVDLPSEATVEQHVAAYQARFLKWIDNAGGVVLDYPDVSHELLASLDVNKVKPFGGDKAGYRDALIWFSILELLAKGKKPAIFVSQNTRDFAAGSQPAQRSLHLDLIEQLRQRGHPADSVRFVGSLDDFVRMFVEPRLVELDEIARQLNAGAYPLLDPEQVLAERFDGLMEGLGVELDPTAIGFSEDADSAAFLGTTGSYSVEDATVKRLSESELLIDVDAWIECEFEVEADSRSELGWNLDDEPFDRWSTVRGTVTKEIAAAVQLTFDTQQQLVTSSRIRRLGEDRKVISASARGNDLKRLRESLAAALRMAPARHYKSMRFD